MTWAEPGEMYQTKNEWDEADESSCRELITELR